MDGDGSDPAKVGGRPRKRSYYVLVLLLRLLGMALTLVAAVVGGVNRETQLIPFNVVNDLPPVQIPVTAKWHYLSATVYFVVSNAIACAYSAISFAILMVNGSCKKGGALATALLILDLCMVGLLFSGNGAEAAVGLIAYNGNSHVQWHKVCNMFKMYCRRAVASIVVSMVGGFVFLWLVAVSALDLHKK